MESSQSMDSSVITIGRNNHPFDLWLFKFVGEVSHELRTKAGTAFGKFRKKRDSFVDMHTWVIKHHEYKLSVRSMERVLNGSVVANFPVAVSGGMHHCMTNQRVT